MKVRSIIQLAQGLGVQILCYFGIFLSVSVAARSLGPNDFGVYASAVAIASFAGSVLTAGLDRILLRVLLQGNGEAPRERVSLSLFLPALALNVLMLAIAGVLTATGYATPNLLFIAMLGGMVAMRLILGGFFKFTLQRYANAVATFGLQPLAVSLVFGALLLLGPRGGVETDLRYWIAVTLLAEAIQAALLFRHARARGMVIVCDNWPTMIRESIDHAKAGIWVSLLVLLAQTGLLALSVGTLLLPPRDMGVYTVALRMSQLIQFPFIGVTQLLVPISSRRYADSEISGARREIRGVILIALGCLVVTFIGFAVCGPLVLRLILKIADPRAYYCTLILSLGNLGMAVFGVGDQIMIALGKHRPAFWISFWCGGVLFLTLFALNFLLGYNLVGLACAAAIPIAMRAFLGYVAARRLVAVPIAAFDR